MMDLHDDRSNSIGALLAHIVAVEQAYQVLTFEDRVLSAEENVRWAAALKLGAEGRRILRGQPLQHYLKQLDSARRKTLEVLASRDDAWLGRQRNSVKPSVENRLAKRSAARDCTYSSPFTT